MCQIVKNVQSDTDADNKYLDPQYRHGSLLFDSLDVIQYILIDGNGIVTTFALSAYAGGLLMRDGK